MLKLNIGISNKNQTIEDELAKYAAAAEYGIDYVSIISIEPDKCKSLWNNIKELHSKTADQTPILCSVPLYESELFEEPILSTFERHYSYGVRAFTIHITDKSTFERAKSSGFIINSRGGQFLWDIFERGEENPILANLDEIIDFCKEHNCELMLGTSLRPGAVEKNMTPMKAATYQELYDAKKIYDFITSKGVSCQVECLGHVDYNELNAYADIFGDTPLCTMGPLLTDCVNGFDELNAIIGYAYARQKLNIKTECMLSRSEHIKMPTVDDVIDECQKWRVAETVVGCALGDSTKAAYEEQKVLDIKGRQRTQCSAHINIFGKIDMPEVCDVCGDKCPLKRYEEI